jgi:hypothetical protein
LMNHFSICRKTEISWDLIENAMKELENKYGSKTKLVDRESFADLIRVVVGSTDDVFVSVMTKLGKTFHWTKTIDISNDVWRHMPASVDVNEFQGAFQTLKDDLRLNESPERVCVGSDLLDFLTMLNCNFCPPPLQQEGVTSKRGDGSNSPLNPQAKGGKVTADRISHASLTPLDAHAAVEISNATAAPLDDVALTESAKILEEKTVANMPQSSPDENRISMCQVDKIEGMLGAGTRGGQFDDPDD